VSTLLGLRSPAFLDLALPGTLVVLDFDGTLARIVRNHREARLSSRTRKALARVAERFPVAVLSGRRVADVASRIAGVPVRWLVGGHGAEWPGDAEAAATVRPRVLAWKRRLSRPVSGIAGAEVEDKGLSLSVHYRSVRRPGAAAAVIADVASQLAGARLIPGKRVINIIPEEAPDKGSALWRMAADTGAGRVLFVGDDDTDELAFRAKLPVPAVTVRVGYDAGSAAGFHVRRRADVDRLLESLASLRETTTSRRRSSG